MGEYEPDDSRIVTNVASEAPGEPPRTGPREDEARASARKGPAKEAHAEGEKGDPTARDATGEKQEGYADLDPEEKAKLKREAGSALP